MKIYKNDNSTSLHHILDPDHTYHTNEDTRKLYSFFKSLSFSNDPTILISLYVSFQIIPFPYEQYPYIYQKFIPGIQNNICKYLDFENATLCHLHHNIFYAVIADCCENDITKAVYHLHQVMSQKTFHYFGKDCTIQIKCGIYFSHIYIDPYEFYRCAKEQYFNTLNDPQTILSVKNSLYDDVFLSHSADNNNELDF